MSKEHQRWKRGDEAKDDKAQTILCAEGIKKNPQIIHIVQDTLIPLTKDVTCPFCLGLSRFNLFLVSNKSGISQNKAQCPLCKAGMLMKTLVQMQTFKDGGEYAKWVFDYRDFWFKEGFNFKVWKDRLFLMHWTEDFWDTYKPLKAALARDREQKKEAGETPDDESFMEYVQRKAQEEADEYRQHQQECCTAVEQG